MPHESYEENLTKEIEKLRNVQKEYIGTKEEVVETLKKLKKSQKEYINLIKEHQKYWNNELESAGYVNIKKREKLKETLKKEEKILEKLERALKHTEERIEFHKKT